MLKYLKKLVFILLGCALPLISNAIPLTSFSEKHRFGMDTFVDLGKETQWITFDWEPQISYSKDLSERYSLQAEYSANIQALTRRKDSIEATKFSYDSYRAWARLSSATSELRIGLQKLSFGSAQILRPLQWFDQINPLDANGSTMGVEALLYRRYFDNNANLWLWTMLSDKTPIGIQYYPSQEDEIEFGGRYQHPIPFAESALSYHQREIALTDSTQGMEHRIGLDLRHDSVIGLWLESSASLHYTDQGAALEGYVLSTLGMDYTFDVSAGLYCLLETAIKANGEKGLSGIVHNDTVSALMMTYPLSVLDKLSLYNMMYWEIAESLHFLSWQRTYDSFAMELAYSWYLGEKPSPAGTKGIMLRLTYHL